MGVRMIVTNDPNVGDGRVALYDSVSGWAFGPLFAEVDEAQDFLDSLDVDARDLNSLELSRAYTKWVDAHSDEVA